jgi:PadR family transcriptional regulator PadR
VETLLSTRAALLQALAAPGYGLELIERVRRATSGLVLLRPGSVYPALHALEQERLVTVRRVQAAGRAGRPRRYYELTLVGVRQAMAQREALVGLLAGVQPAPAVPDVGEMRQGLENCSALSGSVLELQQRMGATARRS